MKRESESAPYAEADGEHDSKHGAYDAGYNVGETLAIFPRGVTERLRLARKVWNEREFIDLRIEFRTADGRWFPSKRGTSIKARELDDLAAALAKASAEAKGTAA